MQQHFSVFNGLFKTCSHWDKPSWKWLLQWVAGHRQSASVYRPRVAASETTPSLNTPLAKGGGGNVLGFKFQYFSSLQLVVSVTFSEVRRIHDLGWFSSNNGTLTNSRHECVYTQHCCHVLRARLKKKKKKKVGLLNLYPNWIITSHDSKNKHNIFQGFSFTKCLGGKI